MPRAIGLIVIGDEILSGKRADKHLPHLIDLLRARGLQLDFAECVGDAPARITQTLVRARESGSLVFCCGGIGATPDDHTRQCAAEAWGVPLALHAQAKALILERMSDVAREQGLPHEPDRADNIHRLNMGVFPAGAGIIPNPYNKIPGFYMRAPSAGPCALAGDGEPSALDDWGGVYFLPGFPVMAWPMMVWVLDTHYSAWFQSQVKVEQSVIVIGAMESTLTPLMLLIEQNHNAVKVFSLPSVDHPQFGRHIELGVKGSPEQVAGAYASLLAGLKALQAKLGPELVR